MKTDFDFLAGGGEMGKVLRTMDWSRTPLGPIESWPQSLRTTVSLCLASNFPISIAWGPERIQIYNDGYWPICGAKHPRSMGQDFRECWLSAWPVIGAAFDQASAGHSAFLENQRIFIDRNGYLEETFFTFSFSPIRDETGGVGGLFHPVTELTQRTLAERRLKVLRDLADRASEAKSVESACELVGRTLADHDLDLPFALLYLVDGEGKEARLAAACGVEANGAWSPASIELQATAAGSWPLAQAARSQSLQQVDDLAARFGALACGPYPEPPSTAFVLPIGAPGLEHPLAFLVAGASSRRALDGPYRTFLEMLQGAVTSALVNARAYEQERKRAEALVEIDRAKTVFFSNVSHEFRTPLTLMLGPVEDGLADTEEPLPPAQRERLKLVHRSGLRLKKLVNTLLDFSRIEAGRAQARYVPTHLEALTADLVSSFRSTIEKAGLELSADCPYLPQPAYVDRDMWEKIVLNLLSNAFKSTFEGGIAVRLRERGSLFELEVSDTGIGIDTAELPRLFERFRRIEGARSRTHEGTGIGLALVQELVKLHGGTVGVRSEVGKGSTFTVSIPVGKTHLPAERIGAAGTLASTAGAAPYLDEALRWVRDADGIAKPPATGQRERIVWADDNADMRDYVRRLLSDRYEVEAVGDGEAALAAVRRRRPDLVLADVMMPNLDGLGLARALRADTQTRAVPVILLSARAGEESRIEGLDAGADDYLQKPFSARELLARIASRLELGRLNAQLDEERSSLARLFAQTPVPTAVLRGPRLVFEIANPAYAEVMGGRDVRGKPLLDALPELGGQGFDDLLHEVMRSGNAHIGRESLVRLERNGRMDDAYFNFIYAPLRGSTGEVDGAMVIANEVTDQVRARQSITDSEARLRFMAESMPQKIFTARPDGSMDYFNPQWTEFTGLSFEDARDWGWTRFVHPDDLDENIRVWQHSIDSGEPLHLEQRFRRADGEYRWHLSRALPMRDGAGRILMWIGSSSDVHELKGMQEALKDADRHKDEFLAMLAHELRNPLASLALGAEILERMDLQDPRARFAVAAIGRQKKQIQRLADDLLDVARVTFGKMALHRQPVDLLAEARSVAADHLRSTVQGVEVVADGTPQWADGDAVRVRQMISNLVENAVKYGGTHVRIRVGAADERAQVTVEDDGKGIAAESMATLFKPFVQEEQALDRAPGGLGLGLALVDRLSALHGGTLEVKSGGPGKGAAFTISLPRAVEPARTEVLQAPGEALPWRRVLVIEDQEDARETLRMLLEMSGHEVSTAADGAEGLAKLASLRPHFALVDIGLPEIDGYEVARRARALPGRAQMTLIALTGYGLDDDQRQASAAGFDLHLTKPVSLEQLMRVFGGG